MWRDATRREHLGLRGLPDLAARDVYRPTRLWVGSARRATRNFHWTLSLGLRARRRVGATSRRPRYRGFRFARSPVSSGSGGRIIGLGKGRAGIQEQARALDHRQDPDAIVLAECSLGVPRAVGPRLRGARLEHVEKGALRGLRVRCRPFVARLEKGAPHRHADRAEVGAVLIGARPAVVLQEGFQEQLDAAITVGGHLVGRDPSRQGRGELSGRLAEGGGGRASVVIEGSQRLRAFRSEKVSWVLSPQNSSYRMPLEDADRCFCHRRGAPLPQIFGGAARTRALVALAAHGPMGLREAARHTGYDSRGVHLAYAFFCQAGVVGRVGRQYALDPLAPGAADLAAFLQVLAGCGNRPEAVAVEVKRAENLERVPLFRTEGRTKALIYLAVAGTASERDLGDAMATDERNVRAIIRALVREGVVSVSRAPREGGGRFAAVSLAETPYSAALRRYLLAIAADARDVRGAVDWCVRRRPAAPKRASAAFAIPFGTDAQRGILMALAFEGVMKLATLRRRLGLSAEGGKYAVASLISAGVIAMRHVAGLRGDEVELRIENRTKFGQILLRFASRPTRAVSSRAHASRWGPPLEWRVVDIVSAQPEPVAIADVRAPLGSRWRVLRRTLNRLHVRGVIVIGWRSGRETVRISNASTGQCAQALAEAYAQSGHPRG